MITDLTQLEWVKTELKRRKYDLSKQVYFLCISRFVFRRKRPQNSNDIIMMPSRRHHASNLFNKHELEKLAIQAGRSTARCVVVLGHTCVGDSHHNPHDMSRFTSPTGYEDQRVNDRELTRMLEFDRSKQGRQSVDASCSGARQRVAKSG